MHSKSSSLSVTLFAFGLLASFFMPWIEVWGAGLSAFGAVQKYQFIGNEVFWLLAIPGLAGLVIWESFTGGDNRVLGTFAGAIMLLALFIGALVFSNKLGSDAFNFAMNNITSVLGAGAYLAVISSVGLIGASAQPRKISPMIRDSQGTGPEIASLVEHEHDHPVLPEDAIAPSPISNANTGEDGDCKPNLSGLTAIDATPVGPVSTFDWRIVAALAAGGFVTVGGGYLYRQNLDKLEREKAVSSRLQAEADSRQREEMQNLAERARLAELRAEQQRLQSEQERRELEAQAAQRANELAAAHVLLVNDNCYDTSFYANDQKVAFASRNSTVRFAVPVGRYEAKSCAADGTNCGNTVTVYWNAGETNHTITPHASCR